MTAPVTPPVADKPSNTRIKSLTAALVAAVGVVAIIVALHPAPRAFALCTQNGTYGDSAAQLMGHLVGSDTMFVMDSAAWARVIPDTTPTLAIIPPCDAVQGAPDTTTAAPPPTTGK